MLKRLPVRRWQSRQWHIEIFNGSPSHLIAREPQWHCVVRGGISLYSEEACIHGTEKNCQCPHAGGRAECPAHTVSPPTGGMTTLAQDGELRECWNEGDVRMPLARPAVLGIDIEDRLGAGDRRHRRMRDDRAE